MYDDISPEDAVLVFVRWEDITKYENWNDYVDGVTTTTIKSVGWLLKNDEKEIVVAGHYNYTDEKWADIHVLSKLPPEVEYVQTRETGV